MTKLRVYLATMAVSAAVALPLLYWDYSIEDFPLDVPLPLKTGSFTLPPFSPSATYGYTVQVRLNNSRPWNELLCETGAKDWPNHRGNCEGRAPDLALEWSMSENARQIASDSSASTDDLTSYKTESGSFAQRYLGYFHGEWGHTYQLTITVRGNPARLAALQPRLQVQLDSTYGMGEAILAAVALLICGVAFLGGVIGAALELLRSKIKSRSTGSTAVSE